MKEKWAFFVLSLGSCCYRSGRDWVGHIVSCLQVAQLHTVSAQDTLSQSISDQRTQYSKKEKMAWTRGVCRWSRAL